jgi:NAD(P)-dependent dehydrogenase (short-subunit alcohol dehydrogenase family)
VRIHYTASGLAAQLMVPQRNGLIISTTFWDRGNYLRPLSYDVSKAAINRMARAMAEELRAFNVAAVALSPGTLRNEYMISPDELKKEYSIPPLVRRDWPKDSFLWKTKSTQYIGRAVAALAADVAVMEKAGKTLLVADLAREYGFTDIDGRQPPPYRISED